LVGARTIPRRHPGPASSPVLTRMATEAGEQPAGNRQRGARTTGGCSIHRAGETDDHRQECGKHVLSAPRIIRKGPERRFPERVARGWMWFCNRVGAPTRMTEADKSAPPCPLGKSRLREARRQAADDRERPMKRNRRATRPTPAQRPFLTTGPPPSPWRENGGSARPDRFPAKKGAEGRKPGATTNTRIPQTRPRFRAAYSDFRRPLETR